MKKKWKNAAERTAAYRERLAQKQEAADEAASEEAQARALDLRFFGESAYNRNAESATEEIYIHRQFLRSLDQPDVKPGETLRQLAKRAWDALLNADGIGIDKCPVHLRDKYESGYDIWIPMFNPKTQSFDGGPGCQGYRVRNAAKDGWFDSHWTAPEDCTGDEIISIEGLLTLPPIKLKRVM